MEQIIVPACLWSLPNLDRMQRDWLFLWLNVVSGPEIDLFFDALLLDCKFPAITLSIIRFL